MTDTRAKTRIFNGELARALAEWESEGGASFQRDRDDHAFLSEADKRVLQCLGAAVIVQWNDLPSRIQRQLFDNATSIGVNGRSKSLDSCTITKTTSGTGNAPG